MTRLAFSQFCDDIRFEVGNKVSAIGMYGGELYLPQIPATLPKLCILAYAFTSRTEPFKTLGFKITLGTQLVQEQNLPEEVLSQIIADIQSRDDPEDPFTRLAITSQVVLSPLNIPEEANLKVVFVADGEELPAGRLKIRRLMQPSDAIKTQS